MEKNKNDISRAEFDVIVGKVEKLEGIFDRINSIAMSTEKLAIEMKYMREEQNKQDERLTSLEQKPIKRYDSIVNYIITTIIGLVIGAVAMLIGLK